MKIHASWNIVVFCLGIIVGDIFVLIFRPIFLSHFLWLILSIILIITAIIISRAPALLLAFSAGVILISFISAPSFLSQNYFQELLGKTVTISGQISKDPTESSGKYNLNLTNLTLTSSDGQELPLSGHLFTQVSQVDIQRSDYLTISGELSTGFGIYAATIFRPSVISIDRPEPGDIFLKVRNFFGDKVRDYLPDKEAGLGLGYLLGEKSGVDQSFQENLRVVGLTHIIVASGAHLGVLVSLARKIFGRLSRFASLLSGGIFMLLFIGITGLSASMLRAGLVTGLSLITWYFGRKIHPARLILMVAAVTLLVEPNYLTDLAWLLSFASFSGILIVSPLLISFFYGKSKKPGPLASTLISSVSAALLCTPILLYFFGTTSLISIFANLLILPTVSIAMGLTFLTGATAIVMSFLAPLTSKLTCLILDYQISVVEFFGDKKMFLIEIPAENPLIFLLYIPIVVVIITTTILQSKKRQKIRKLQKSIEPMLA